MISSPRLLSKKQVKELVLYSYAHTDRLEKAGLFPKRLRLSPHRMGRVAYLEDEIFTWIEKRLAERDAS